MSNNLQIRFYPWFIRLFASWYFVLFLVPSSHLNAQEWSIQHFGTDEGLPGNITYRIIQDDIGYIWIPTNNGIARFDGKDFKAYNSPLIKNNEILKCRSIQGSIWLLNWAGKVYIVHHDEILEFNPNGLLNNKTVVDFIEDHTGQIMLLLLSPEYGLEILFVEQWNSDSDRKTKQINLPDIDYFNLRLYLKKIDQSVFIIGNQEIKEYRPETHTFQDKIFEEQMVFNIPVKFQNQELISYKEDMQHPPLFKKYQNGNWKNLPISFSPDQGEIRGVFQDHQSRIWTYGDELVLWDSSFQFIENLTSSINHQRINEIEEDREGNIWISTNGDGVYVFYNSPFIQYNKKNSALPGNYIFDVDGDHNGNIFLISHPSSLLSMSDGLLSDPMHVSNSKLEMYDLMVSSKNEVIVSLGGTHFFQTNQEEKGTNLNRKGSFQYVGKRYYETRDGELFFLTGGVILSFKDSIFMISEPFIDAGAKEYCLLKDANDRLIIGTNKGVYSLTNHSSILGTKECTIPIKKTTINCYIPQAKTLNLDFLINRNQITQQLDVYKSKSKVSKHYFEDSLTIDYYMSDIKEGPDGALWLATKSNGLYQVENNKIVEHYTASETGLSSNICNRIFIDSSNTVWLATVGGLNQIDPKQKQIRKITIDDGLSSNHVTSVYKHQSTIYVGTAKGLTVFDEKDIKPRLPPPPVMLRDIRINEQDTVLESSYNLKWNQNSLNIGFIAPFFQGKINYQYRLKGAFDNWIQTSDNYVRFAELNPGKYTFEVKSKSKDGQESAQLASLDIRIRPHPLQSTLAYMLYGLLFFSLLGFVFWWRIRQIKRQEAEKTAINKKFAELELQALQAQMNPHFVFNAMNAIQNYIAQQDVHKANSYLSEFGKLMRMFLDSTRKKYIYIEEEIELLQLYLKLEKLRFREKITVIFDVDPDLEQDIEIPSMILQPFLENAINHGLSHKAENGTLTISMIQEENRVKITIEDDGIGREAANKIKQKSFKGYESYGMKIVEERLATLDMIDDYKIKIDITDLKDETNKPLGTRVTVQIPIID